MESSADFSVSMQAAVGRISLQNSFSGNVAQLQWQLADNEQNITALVKFFVLVLFYSKQRPKLNL